MLLSACHVRFPGTYTQKSGLDAGILQETVASALLEALPSKFSNEHHEDTLRASHRSLGSHDRPGENVAFFTEIII